MTRSHARGRGRKLDRLLARLRRTRSVERWFVVAALAAHVLTAWVGCLWFPPALCVPVVALLFLATAARLLLRDWPDKPRPRLARYWDALLFINWAYGILAVPLVLGSLALMALAKRFESTAVLQWEPREVWAACYAGALLMAVWGVLVCRRWVRVTRAVVDVPGLPTPFNGYQITHLTDLHIGSVDHGEAAQRWVELANRARSDLVVVTGDLLTSGTSFHAQAAQLLGRLRAKDGVIVTLGNHDQWDPDRLVRLLEEQQVKVLRNESLTIERAGQAIAVTGLDASPKRPEELDRALASRPQAAFSLLLSHYPDFFEQASERGVALVLSGHTHGGQVGLPLFGDRINVASITGQRSRGMARRGASRLFVSAGLGTTGLPIRLGVRPEIAVLVLSS